jgi:hypothetical protein
MNTSDGMALMFPVHFQEAQLQEVQDSIKFADTSDVCYFQTTTNNPQFIAEIDCQRQIVIKAQIQLDRMVLQPSSDLSPPQIRDVL